MVKVKTKNKLWMYFLIGLFVSLLSVIISIPIALIFTGLAVTGIASLMTILLILWIPVGWIISGWIIVNVVKWFGFKKGKR